MKYKVIKKRVLISSNPEIYMDDITIVGSILEPIAIDEFLAVDDNVYYSIDRMASSLLFIYGDYAALLLDKERNKRPANDNNPITIRFVGIFDGTFMNYLSEHAYENETSNGQLNDMLDKLKKNIQFYCFSNNITTEPVVAVYATKKEMESVGYFEHSHDTGTEEYYEEQRTVGRFMSIKASILAENGFVNKEYSPGIGHYDTYIVFGLPTLSTTLSELNKLHVDIATQVDQFVKEVHENNTLIENVLNALPVDN